MKERRQLDTTEGRKHRTYFVRFKKRLLDFLAKVYLVFGK